MTGTFALSFQVRRADPNILTALTWRKMFIANESYCGPSRYKEWWKQLLAPLLDSIWELHLHSWVYDFLGVSVFLSHPAHFSRYFSLSCLQLRFSNLQSAQCFYALIYPLRVLKDQSLMGGQDLRGSASIHMENVVSLQLLCWTYD